MDENSKNVSIIISFLILTIIFTFWGLFSPPVVLYIWQPKVHPGRAFIPVVLYIYATAFFIAFIVSLIILRER